MDEKLLRIVSHYNFENIELSQIKDDKKMYLLSFDLEHTTTINLFGENVTKDDVIKTFDHILENIDHYKTLHKDKALIAILKSKHLKEEYHYNHDLSFSRFISTTIVNTMVNKSKIIFESSFIEFFYYKNLMQILDKMPKEMKVGFRNKFDTFLNNYVDILEYKLIDCYKQNNIDDHWSYKKHQIIIQADEEVLDKYHKWVEGMIGTMASRYSDLSKDDISTLNFMCVYYKKINPSSMAEAIESFILSESKSEEDSFSRMLPIIIIALLTILRTCSN
jgi:hypothetical protein